MTTRDTSYSRPGITGDDAAPDGTTKGVPSEALSEIAWFLTADDEARTCTVTPWYKKGADWHKGTGQSVTGNSVVMGYTLGGDTWLQLTSVTGTWQVRATLVEKTA